MAILDVQAAVLDGLGGLGGRLDAGREFSAQEAPRGSKRLQEAPRGSKRPQEAPRGPKRLQEAPRGAKRLQKAPRGHERSEAPYRNIVIDMHVHA